MTKISDVSNSVISAFAKKAAEDLIGASSLERAGQRLTELMYEEFKESIVMARFFATAPFNKLPDFNKQFVTQLAASKGISELIKDQTLVLSLLGTYGDKDEWKDRHNSKGHIGIPLVSADFITLIPMISRLLKMLGVPFEWISSTDTGIVTKALGSIFGVFYVPDAKTAVDEHNRKIITMQDFVDSSNIKTVFGLAGGYISGVTFVVLIVFTRETVSKYCVEQFMPLINSIKMSTAHLVSEGKIFSEE